MAEKPLDDGAVLRQAAVAIAVAGNFRSITDAQQVQMEKVFRNKAAGDIWISMTDGAVIVSDNYIILEVLCPISPGTFSSDLLLTSNVKIRPQPYFYDLPLRRSLERKYFLAGYFIYV